MQDNPTIPPSTGFLMLGTAALFDTLQAILNLIPLFGQVASTLFITIPAGLVFWLWFKIQGGSFSKTRQVALGGGFLVEFIPLINALPAWSAAVLICLGSQRITKWVSKIKRVPGLQNSSSKAP